MMSISIHKNAIKTTLIVIYTTVTALILYGLSAVFAYLNTGADRNLMLHNKIHETVHYQPEIVWKTNQNPGRAMDENTLQRIEKDYLNAWYVKHVAFEKNTTKGLKDYYTKSALKTISKALATNKKNNTSIKSTTLAHDISLEFFSEDGQLVVLTDSNVKEHKQIYHQQELQLETTETNTYRILLLLEDGFWRIRHILKNNHTQNPNQNLVNKTLTQTIKGINYYPQDTPWDMFGDEFDPKIIAADFEILKNVGLNTIRIFIQYEDFGKSDVKPEKLIKLQKVLDIAQNKNLGVIITLFDFYGNYDVLDWTLNNKHATTIVNACKNHPALLAWDVKNEPNLDFESRGKENVLSWLDQIIFTVKSADTTHPVTIGWSDITSATLLQENVDFVSFHYYEDLNLLSEKYQKLQLEIPNKKIVLGEYGISSYKGFWNPFGHNEDEQARYYKHFQEIAIENNIEYISWTLYDFTKIPKAVVGKLPWRKNNQKHFGFIDSKGKRKKSFQYITAY